jgi:hypothetical protein
MPWAKTAAVMSGKLRAPYEVWSDRRIHQPVALISPDRLVSKIRAIVSGR